ncbi:MAG: 2,3-bisphosphoglycerate-independent phosphoglycerate mutase [bacterium]
MKETIINNKEEESFKRPKPVVLVILDGWGVNQSYVGNAITQANTPNIKKLIAEYPSTTLRASGEAVGLPWGESGNSEVGHISLGLGRILYQDLPRIIKDINDGNFFKNPALLEAIEHAKKNNSKLHLMGLISGGSVHASIEHLYVLLSLLKKEQFDRVYIHAILDGRDSPYNSGFNFIRDVERAISEYGIGKIATISGRFYTMDRNNNWDRTFKAYSAMVGGNGNSAEDPSKAVEESYQKKIYDEEFIPTVIAKEGEKPNIISDNDSVIFFNFRADRARQITKAFTASDFDKFERRILKNLNFTCFTEYEKGLSVKVAFPSEKTDNSLGEIFSTAGLQQLRISETEKYAHVTYFFNGGHEEKSSGEDHCLVPSPQVSSYDQKPEMSSGELTKKVLEAIESDKYDFILINYPNADMVGHTGNMEATVKAIEILDKCVERITSACLAKNGMTIITADHGNADVMINMQTGQIDKKHSSDPVPFVIVSNEYQGQNFGWPNVVDSDLSMIKSQGILADVAPTILKIMGLKKPDEMKGISLI